MKSAIFLAWVLYSGACLAGYGSMGSYEAAERDSGPITLLSVVGAAAYFGGLFWLLSRAPDDMTALRRLVGGVGILLLIGTLAQCT